MKTTILRSQLKAVGLVIEKTGIVRDERDVFHFAKLGKDSMETVDGRQIPIKEIESVAYADSEHRLTLGYENGPDEDLPAGRFRPEEIPMYEMPKSTSAFNDAFDIIYPDNATQLYYDELREREMIDMSMLDRPDMGVVPFSDRVLAMYHDHAQRRLSANGFIGTKYPSNEVLDEVLRIRVGDHRRNLFREWVESHEWDGVPRLRTCFIDYCGVEAPALQSDNGMSDEEKQYIGDVTEAWFIGGIKRMYSEIAHEVVPVLIGGQGAGKTNVLKFLSGDNAWYRSTVADVARPDKFLESIRGAVVVELGESKQIRTQDNETLKAFISQSSDQLRMPYARYDECFPRHFIMIATSNLDSVFTDVTGSRRFYPLYCNPHYAFKSFPTSVRGAKYQYEVEQLWAEALALYRQGHKWFVPRATMKLAKKMQKYCAVENPGISIIESYLDDPANKLTAKGSRITKNMIFRDIFGLDPGLPSQEAERAYRAWRVGTERWKQASRPFSMEGKTVRGFYRVFEPGEDIVDATFKMVDGDEEDDSSEEKIAAKFANLLREKGLCDVDDPIDLAGVSDDDIEEFSSEGFIYNLGTNTKPDYHVGALP